MLEEKTFSFPNRATAPPPPSRLATPAMYCPVQQTVTILYNVNEQDFPVMLFVLRY